MALKDKTAKGSEMLNAPIKGMNRDTFLCGSETQLA